MVKLISRPVSGNYLNVMGVRALLGRLLSPEDEKSKTRVAVMMYSCWKRMGADPNIVGKVFAKQTIVGVMPKEFSFQATPPSRLAKKRSLSSGVKASAT